MTKKQTKLEKAIADERAAFEKVVDGLLEDHEGEIVVFKGEPIAFFDEYDDAYREAMNRFGPGGGALVTRVAPSNLEPISWAWEAGVLFG